MSFIKQKKHPLIILLTFFILFVGAHSQVAYGFSEQIIQRGATGDDVVELQARLQWIGFFDGKIDGVFGWSTYWAVRHYQDEFGMEVDGIVDQKMKESLSRTTEFKKDFVHKALREGRKFTHYGGVDPFEIQKGPKGSEDGQVTQIQQQRQQQQQQEQEQRKQQQQPSPGEAQGAAPGATPAPGGSPEPGATPAPGGSPESGATPAPGGSPEPGATPAPGGSPEPGATPAPGGSPTPEVTPAPEQQGEPVPDPETPEAQDDEPTIEKAMNVPDGFSENDIQIMAQAVYGEARGEPYVGQVAIAAVILNRMNSPTFPNTASGVIFEPRAFTAVADGQIYMTPNETARKAVLDAINGQDPSGGATYYFNPDTATNAWIWSRPQIKKIGKHIFCN